MCNWQNGGLNLKSSKLHIGEGVIFDSLYPEEIEIGEHVHITMNCIILTHNLFLHDSESNMHI